MGFEVCIGFEVYRLWASFGRKAQIRHGGLEVPRLPGLLEGSWAVISRVRNTQNKGQNQLWL